MNRKKLTKIWKSAYLLVYFMWRKRVYNSNHSHQKKVTKSFHQINIPDDDKEFF